ncbi:unnamed protein product, partial [Candidula unifasciata]
MGELCKFRSSLVSNTLTKEHAEEMKKQVVTRIDWGNGYNENISTVYIVKLHERL